MREDDAFFLSIAECPDHDTPRLIYADWLEDHDQPERASSIRLQCQLASLRGNDARRVELAAQERALLERFGNKWLGPLAVLRWEPPFRRGFPALDGILVYAGQGGAADDATVQALAASPHLLWVINLNLNVPISDENARALADSPYVIRVTRLNLSDGRISAAGLRDLIDSPNLARVHRLMLNGGRTTLRQSTNQSWPTVDLAGVRALATSPKATRLTALELLFNELEDEAVDALIDSPYLRNLEHLRVRRGNRFTEEALDDLRQRFGEAVC